VKTKTKARVVFVPPTGPLTERQERGLDELAQLIAEGIARRMLREAQDEPAPPAPKDRRSR
jgi:hypothetical protein